MPKKIDERADSLGPIPFVGNGSTDFIDTPGHQLVPGDWQPLENVFPPLDTPIEPSVEKKPRGDWDRMARTVDRGIDGGDYTAEMSGRLNDQGKFVIDSFSTIPATDHDALEAELAAGVEKVIATREATHGSYADTARVAQILKRILRGETAQYETLTFRQRESLDLICTKLARIVSGNANEPDHWLDIQGYAKIAIDE